MKDQLLRAKGSIANLGGILTNNRQPFIMGSAAGA
jgi:hypothetical protein